MSLLFCGVRWHKTFMPTLSKEGNYHENFDAKTLILKVLAYKINITPMLYRMFFLITNVWKVGYSSGFPSEKLSGRNDRLKACSLPRGQAFGLTFHPSYFPLGNPSENP